MSLKHSVASNHWFNLFLLSLRCRGSGTFPAGTQLTVSRPFSSLTYSYFQKVSAILYLAPICLAVCQPPGKHRPILRDPHGTREHTRASDGHCYQPSIVRQISFSHHAAE